MQSYRQKEYHRLDLTKILSLTQRRWRTSQNDHLQECWPDLWHFRCLNPVANNHARTQWTGHTHQLANQSWINWTLLLLHFSLTKRVHGRQKYQIGHWLHSRQSLQCKKGRNETFEQSGQAAWSSMVRKKHHVQTLKHFQGHRIPAKRNHSSYNVTPYASSFSWIRHEVHLSRRKGFSSRWGRERET